MSNVFDKKSFYLTHPDGGVEMMLHKMGATREQNEWDADFLVFPGGADIHPLLYGERAIPGTSCNVNRDLKEVNLFKSMLNDIPKIGICRGAQLVNTLSGGSMWQNVDGHTQTHALEDSMTGEILETTSTHHQMMIPGDDGVILATAAESSFKECEEAGSVVRTTIKHTPRPRDIEVMYYETTNSLCFQGHPEYDSSECLEYFLHLVRKQWEGNAACVD